MPRSRTDPGITNSTDRSQKSQICKGGCHTGGRFIVKRSSSILITAYNTALASNERWEVDEIFRLLTLRIWFNKNCFPRWPVVTDLIKNSGWLPTCWIKNRCVCCIPRTSETLENVPPYAILSHRWFVRPKGEVSFQDLQRRQVPSGGDLHSDVEHTFLPDVRDKAGFLKLKGACNLALQDGLNYIWIDTCCIDKTSSAELSEAINSMYDWYRDSAVCYVYLHDVYYSPDQNTLISAFRDAEWFKRGWTLQELLAPSNVYFFAHDWSRIGSKATWVSVLHDITHIRKEILLGISSSFDPSIAEKMSWAVGRKTEKIEDRAYSLMGIFEIHMPIIYGEGEKAFKRLQLEIMKISNDQTIFAWHDSLNYPHPQRTRGVLASSPDVFLRDEFRHPLINVDHSSLSHYMPLSVGWHGFFQNQSIPEDGHTIQNDGIHITLPMKPSGDSWLAVLTCKTDGQQLPYGIYLWEVSGSNKFLRSAPTRLHQLELSDLEGLTLKKIRMVIDHPPPPTIPRGEFFTLRSANEVLNLCSYYICPGPGRHEGQGSGWEPLCSDTRIELGNTRCGCVCFQDGHVMAILLLGIEDHRPWIHLLTDPDLLRFIDAPPRSPSTPIFITSQFTSEPLPKDTDPISPLLLSPTATPGSSTHQDSQKRSRSSTHQNSRKRSRTPRPVQLQESTNGCAVCAIIRRGSINIPEITATRADMLDVEVLGNVVEVVVRKGRAGTSEIQPGLVEYVLTISVES